MHVPVFIPEASQKLKDTILKCREAGLVMLVVLRLRIDDNNNKLANSKSFNWLMVYCVASPVFGPRQIQLLALRLI